ncbi:mandelate racemase/muconate lactonizing enzyme family protein [Candidatus Latescibacterota bacterium]
MKRRTFLKSAVAGAGAAIGLVSDLSAAIPEMKITGVRVYKPNASGVSPMLQSAQIVTVETDAGITGIGEGGSIDSVESCATKIIGQNPSRTEFLWQRMDYGEFYPAGRERMHALGALDLALWDIKGKALDVPVYELLGGRNRDYLECYATGFPGNYKSLKERAAACIRAGFRAYRIHGADPGRGEPFDSRKMVNKTYEMCKELHEGVGPDGDWAIDFHTRYDRPDAVRLCSLIEELNPYFVEDLIRIENTAAYKTLRGAVNVPIAVGEQFGDKWDIHELIEQDLIDYSRVTLPNAGGITEYMKLAALCETHYVGLIPHFTGPVSTAANVHACGVFSGPVLAEMTGGGRNKYSHLPEYFDFRDGKLWLNDRPGLGVEFDSNEAELVAEFTEPGLVRGFNRPDGSYTNW